MHVSAVSNLEQLVRKVEVGRAPRRLSWLREKVATATAPIPISFAPPQIPGATVTVNGSMHVVADANVPTDVNGDQDVAIVLRDTALLELYTSKPSVFLDFSSGAANLKVRVIVRRYASYSAARLPAAVGILGGSGLVAP